MFKCQFESVKIVSAELETPKVILGVPRAFSLIMVRDCIKWSSLLRVVSRDNTDDMGVRSHNRPGVPCQNAPPPTVSDYTGDIVDPTIEIKA